MSPFNGKIQRINHYELLFSFVYNIAGFKNYTRKKTILFAREKDLFILVLLFRKITLLGTSE